MNRILSKSCYVLVSLIVLVMLALGHTVTAGELEEAAKKECLAGRNKYATTSQAASSARSLTY